MQRKFVCAGFVCFLSMIAIAQPGKIPVKSTIPKATLEPLQISRMATSKASYEYKSKNGKVEISYARGKQPKDGVKTTSKETSEAMCLSRDEVRGQKIENLQVIIDGSKASQILPGGVFDGEMLLKSGEFKYVKMNKRQPISISLVTNQGDRHKVTVDKKGDNNVEDDLRAAVNSLTSPSNIKNMPNYGSSSEVITSTIEENTGLKIGASFFYMGVSANNKLSFSSSSYHYMYLYQFEQECLSVVANTISSPADLFTDGTTKDDNLLYIREVKYGRRLYVIIESENELQSYSDKLKGSLDWAVVSAAFSQNIEHSSLFSKTNIKVNTQGGSPIGAFEKENIQAVLNNYFAKPFKQIDIVPIAYKLTYMDGEPVSMVSNAFLDGKNCLDKEKVKIRLTSVKCIKQQNEKKQEEVYGGVNIYYYNPSKQLVAANAITPMPVVSGFRPPTGTFTFGTKEAPVALYADREKNFQPDEQGKYTVFLLPDLDMTIEIVSYIHEKDNVFNKDDDFITENRMKKTIRQMLLEGSMSPTFEFRHNNAIIKLFFEILPEN